MDLTRRRLLATLFAAPLAAMTGRAAEEDSALPQEQLARLKKFLPRTLPKLQRRDPVFVAICGDEISAFYQPGRGIVTEQMTMAWYGRFLDRLGASFYYHGGVVDTSPPSPDRDANLEKQWETYRKERAQWEKAKKKGEPPVAPGLPDDDAQGALRSTAVNDIVRNGQPVEATIPSPSAFYADNYAAEGAVGVQVMDPLLSTVFHAEETGAADLVIIAYGARDALSGTSLRTFRAALDAAIAECRKKGADVILAGPPPALDEADERSAVGRSRPWAAVMREAAEAAGVYFADLGAAAFFQPSDLINRTVEGTFKAAIDPVRRMFDHGSALHDGFHPNAASHLIMGETAADWLRYGTPVRPFEVSGELVMSGGPGGEDVLTVRVASTGKEPITIGLCPLRFAGWSVKPGTPDRVHTFLPGRGARKFKFVMQRNDEPLQGHEEFIRGSLIISDDDAQHLVDVKVPVLPLMVLWPEERVDGAGGDHLLKCTLVNTGRQSAEVALSLDWQGVQAPLTPVKVAAGERVSLPLRIALPPVAGAFRFKDNVVLNVTSEGHTWKFTRRVEGVRHIGLKDRFPLVPLAKWQGKPSPEDTAAAGAFLKVQADQKAIYFQIEVPAATVSDVVEGKPWGRLEVQIDGRKAGENGTMGCVGTMVVEVPYEEGACRLLPVKPAVFGNGYAYPYDLSGFRRLVKVNTDGRVIQFNMVRVFLQHHEWSLDGSGQNDLGINVRLALCDEKAGGFTAARTYVLSASAFPSADARSLTLLELRGNPAARWSLRIG